jgi:molecular chaperone GrpE
MVKKPAQNRPDPPAPDRPEIGPPESIEEDAPARARQNETRAEAVGGTAGGAQPTGVVVPAPEEIEALRRERDEEHDRLLRLAAEFDNYRKRVERERREQADYAAATLLRALLPILDDFERALQADVGGDAEGYRKGVDLIYRQLVDLLASRGVKPIQAVGSGFDPRFHEAVLHVESPGHESGQVIEEFRRGYTMGERLLRPALVKVAKA